MNLPKMLQTDAAKNVEKPKNRGRPKKDAVNNASKPSDSAVTNQTKDQVNNMSKRGYDLDMSSVLCDGDGDIEAPEPVSNDEMSTKNDFFGSQRLSHNGNDNGSPLKDDSRDSLNSSDSFIESLRKKAKKSPRLNYSFLNKLVRPSSSEKRKNEKESDFGCDLQSLFKKRCTKVQLDMTWIDCQTSNSLELLSYQLTSLSPVDFHCFQNLCLLMAVKKMTKDLCMKKE